MKSHQNQYERNKSENQVQKNIKWKKDITVTLTDQKKEYSMHDSFWVNKLIPMYNHTGFIGWADFHSYGAILIANRHTIVVCLLLFQWQHQWTSQIRAHVENQGELSHEQVRNALVCGLCACVVADKINALLTRRVDKVRTALDVVWFCCHRFINCVGGRRFVVATDNCRW